MKNPTSLRRRTSTLIIISFATCALANLAFAQSEQLIRFDGGRDDRARCVTTDAVGNIFTGGQVESTARPAWFAVVKHNAQGVLQWVAHYNGSSDQVQGFVSSVATDAAGNIYAAGYIARQITFLTQNIDWLVVSFTPNGAQRWAHVFNSPGDGFDQASRLVLDPAGALYVTGMTGSGNDFNWLTVKYSLDGAVQWQRTRTGTLNGDDRPVAMKLDANGNVLVLGHTSNTSTGFHDLSLMKYDAHGNMLWMRDYADGPTSDEFPADLAVDAAGNAYATGIVAPTGDPEGLQIPFLLKYDTSGTPQFQFKSENAGGSSVVLSPDGNVVVAGTVIGEVASFIRASVSKFSPAGAQLWTTRLDPVGNTFYDGKVVATGDGSVYFGGYKFTTAYDFVAARFTANGQPLWQRVIPEGNAALDAHLAANGDFLVTGDTDGSAPDMLTVRYPAGFVPPPVIPVPTAPAALMLTAGKGKLTLQWADNSNDETGFRIERAINGGSFAQIAQVNANVRTFVDSGLNKKNIYNYRVRAFNAGGNSAYSNTASARPQ